MSIRPFKFSFLRFRSNIIDIVIIIIKRRDDITTTSRVDRHSMHGVGAQQVMMEDAKAMGSYQIMRFIIDIRSNSSCWMNDRKHGIIACMCGVKLTMMMMALVWH